MASNSKACLIDSDVFQGFVLYLLASMIETNCKTHRWDNIQLWPLGKVNIQNCQPLKGYFHEGEARREIIF